MTTNNSQNSPTWLPIGKGVDYTPDEQELDFDVLEEDLYLTNFTPLFPELKKGQRGPKFKLLGGDPTHMPPQNVDCQEVTQVYKAETERYSYILTCCHDKQWRLVESVLLRFDLTYNLDVKRWLPHGEVREK